MLLKDIQLIFHETLNIVYGKDEVDSMFYLLTQAFYNVNKIQLILQPDFTITKNEQEPIFNALENLKQQKPLQYILGETEFYGLPFKVDESVLIPRPETEELVDWIIKYFSSLHSKSQFNILDIGTGSGCIAISLAKNISNARVYALDVSKKALDIARENAKLNGIDVHFVELNILDENSWNLEFSNSIFDVIVSNPPYVRSLEKIQIKKNVLEYEPHLALFVEDKNPLLFYDAIARFSVNNLTQNGQLFFEINEYLGNEMEALLEQYGFQNIELKKDLFGKDRMIKGLIKHE